MVGATALALGVLLVLLRGEPYVASDQGVFLSVAGRLLDGDRLYSEVFDNKDPLFFYTYAAALWVGGWRGPFMLDAVWLALAGISVALLARELRAPRPAVAAGLAAYPLALAAGWYLVGLSMLGALAVAPLVPWLWLRRRFAAAGAFVVVGMLLKLNLAPVVAAPIVALVALGAPSVPRWAALRRGGLGFGAALLAAAAYLGARGELRSYLDAIAYNVHYASARTGSEGLVGRAVEHLRVVTDFFYLAGRWQLPLALLVLGALLLAGVVAWRRDTRERVLVAVALVALAAAVVVIAASAYDEQHLQLLAYPAALVAVALTWAVHASFGVRAAWVAAVSVAAFAVWSCLKVGGGTEVSPLWTAAPISPGAIALERARERLLSDERSIPYMVFGSNSEGGHAAFIGREFDLTCRYFHLYTFSRADQFDETLECAERERPVLVLVTLGFFEPYGDFPEWNAFRSRARRLLSERYRLVEEEHPGVQVWSLRAP